MQAKPIVVSFVISYCESFFSLLLKLLAYLDEATVLLYFAQSVSFGENKHKPIVSSAEEENRNGKEGCRC